jgi:hypothetical protein
VLNPQVLGPADAGTAWMTTNANASARIVLIDMIVLLLSKPKRLLQTGSGGAAFISAHAFEWNARGTSPRVRDDVQRSHRRHLQHHGIVMDWARRTRSKALLLMSGRMCGVIEGKIPKERRE